MTDSPEVKALLETAKIYEQILQKMPDDVYSIEELVSIYEEIGDEEKINSFKDRLEKISRGEEVGPLETDDAPAPAQQSFSVRNTNKISNRKVSLKARPSVSDPVPPSWRRKNQELDQIKLTKQLADLVFTLQYSMKSQVDLLIRLYDVGVLAETQMAEIMYNLAEHKFPRDPKKPEMVMHMLEACDGVELDKVYYFLSKKSQLPYIDLSVMQFNAKLYELFPLTLVYNHGIVIFKKMKNDFCIAILNPLNPELMKHVVNLLGQNVHFFLTSACEFDLFLKKNPRPTVQV
jgi:hypothetical protein